MVEQFENFLEHYGIKGMRWGVTRPEGSNGRVVRTEAITSVDGTGKLRVSGGTGYEPHGDAVKAKISKQVAEKSGLQALSSEDLQSLVNRMNLEQNYARLNPAQISRGQKFMNEAGKIAGNAAKTYAQQEANKAFKKHAEGFSEKFNSAMKDAAAAAASSRSSRRPKDGGTYTVVRKALGA